VGRYLGTQEEWSKLCNYLLTQAEVGVDTESQEAEEGGSGARDLYVWSVAGFKPGGALHPRGYRPAIGYCLPRGALETFRPLFESEKVIKWVHNAPADTRPIFDNAGIVLRRARCTLQHARVALPNAGQFGLKFLAQACLGKPSREGYLEVISYTGTKTKEKTKKTKLPCTCGAPKCKKRKGHLRETVLETVTTSKEFTTRYNQADLIPGHARFPRWVDYAIADAVDALELASFLSMYKDRRPGDPFGPEAQEMARRNNG
jgi:hypothetical protein